MTAVPADAPPGRRPRFLLVGLDGVRLDRLRQARTPHLDALAARGFFHTARIPEHQPIRSGPQWATILTGAWSRERGAGRRAGHGVRRNWWPSRRLGGHADLLQRVRAADPSATTFAAVSWPVLARRAGCGPVLRSPAFLPVRRPTTLASWVRADAAVVDHAERRLRDPACTAGFVYLGEVDMAGHLSGTGERYVAAVEHVDAHLGRLLRAIDDAGTRAEWTVLVTTDHGHRDAGGHGGRRRTDAEATVWFASDNALPGWERLDSAGVPAFAFAALGLAPAA